MNKLQIAPSIPEEVKEIIDVSCDDEDLENNLKTFLDQLDDEKRTQIIQSLHQMYPQQTFLRRPYFAQTQENLREQYSENQQEKKFDQILLVQKIEQYCKQNLIPSSIKDYRIPLQKLENDLHLIVDLIEVVKQKGQPNFISFLKLLINLFFLECENQIKGQIHQLVGFLLENQIYKFQYYIAQVTQDEYIQLYFLDCIYKVQSKQISVKQGKESLQQNCKDKQILFLFELFTLKHGSHTDNLLGFIKSLICVKSKKVNKDELIQYVSLTENFNENLDFLYLKLVFYFWIQFIEIFNIKESILNVENGLSRSEKKKQFLENNIKKLNSKENNMIYRYLIQKILHYSTLEDEDFKEGYCLQEAQEKQFIQKVGQFKSSNTEKLQEFAETSKKLMFYQLKSLQSQQQYLTKEINILYFLATNELNINQYKCLINIIKTNLHDHNDRKLNNFPKELKINLLHLEQSLKSESQIKMSRFFIQNETFNQYPNKLMIKMEDFNISLTSNNQMQQTVNYWLEDKRNKDNYNKLLPYYFNIIKRGESPEELLSLINKKVIQEKEGRRNETLNFKSLFQLLYINSDKELQMMLLKLHSKNHPVPLLYQNPYLEKGKTSIKDCYVFNANIFYLLQNDFPIINFSLTQTVNQFGKSELINMLFYSDQKEDQKFEISDSSSINNHSVDCQFDFSFNGSRNYLIADVHGQLEDEIFQELLPFFQLWIIQMQTEDEFDETVDKLIVLCEKMKLNCKPKIILIIRDSEKKELNKEKIKQLKKKEFDFCTSQIQNLHQQENQAIKKAEREKIKMFILQQIGTRNETVQEAQIQNSFLQICNAFNVNDQEIRKSQDILNNLTDELNKIIQNENGFYQIEAFPLRNLALEINSKKQQRQQLNFTSYQLEQELEKKKDCIVNLKNEQNRDQEEKIKQKENEKLEIENKIKQTKAKLEQFQNEIENLEVKLRKPKFNESQLIKYFSLIFTQENYYVTYLRFVEHIAKFNQKNLKNLNIKIEDIRQQLDSLKQEQIKEREELEEKLKSLENKFRVQNINIEIFWREVIKGNSSFQQNPINQVCQLIKKGEPFEFLNGDDLTIDFEFLFQLRERLLDKDDNKILCLSILGPQSSGKSTLLNRIFGCHFLTSMGKCTKGLFLQLLKISNREQFQYSFDYILLLDSEGLQSPNQQDPEFDKKISLFIIQISDILIFNVKGEIHSTFQKLIEVSFYTIAKYSKLQFLKQFSWCFNQNSQNNEGEKYKLLNQVQDIGKRLSLEEILIEEDGKKIEYFKQLDLTINNIYILGMATNLQKWQNSDDSRQNQFQEMIQEINNQDYSKNAISFGIDIINKFIKKYREPQNKHNDNFTWNAFITKVQQCWEIVSKLPDLVEFSDLKEQKDYETINKIATDKMVKVNEKFQDFDAIIYQIEEKCKLYNNSQENYDQIQKDAQQDFISKCNTQKEEILNELQREYSYQIISNSIKKKVEGNISEVYYAIALEGTLIILQKIHQLRREFQYSRVPAKIQQTLNEILNNSELLKTLQEDKSLRDNKFEQIWSELVEPTNQELKSLHTEFQKTLFECFSKYKKYYQYKIEDMDEQIDYFARQINSQDPRTQKENQMEKICSLFLKVFQQNSFKPIDQRSNLQFQQTFYQDINDRLNNLPQSPFIDPWKYLTKEITFQAIEKKKIVELLQQSLKPKLIQIVQKETQEKEKQLEIKSLFNSLNMLPIQFDQLILKNVLNLIESDFSIFLKGLTINNQQERQQSAQFQQPPQNQFQGNSNVNPQSHDFTPQSRSNCSTNPFSFPQQGNLASERNSQQQYPIQHPYPDFQNPRPVLQNPPFALQIPSPVLQNPRPVLQNPPFALQIPSPVQQNSFSGLHNRQNIQFNQIVRFPDPSIDSLINSLKVSETQTQTMDFFKLNNLYGNFPGLYQLQESLQMNNIDKTQYFILKENVSIKFKQRREKPNYQYCFKYIISQNNTPTNSNDFQLKFPPIFIEIMEENQGWIKLCSTIYDIIQKQFDEIQLSDKQEQQKYPDIFYFIIKDENVTRYDRQLLQRIIKNVEIKLEQINKEIAFFGIEFTQVLIRKLQFFSCFIIWRFICYEKLKIYQKEQYNFLKQKEAQKVKYENSILQKQKKASQYGKEQAIIIYQLCIRQFYQDQKINIKNQIIQNKMSSSQLIKKLDQEILVARKDNFNQNQNVEASIIQYICDQRKYMELHIEKLIIKLQKDIVNLLDIQSYVQNSLGLIKNNATILLDKTKILLSDQSQILDGNENQNVQLDQILNYILGKEFGKKEQNLYQQIFLYDERIKQVNLPIQKILQKDAIIQFLDTFLEEFITQISILYDESKELVTLIDEFELKGQFEEMKNIMNGCNQSCPICNRKCDSELYNEVHQHKCTNGHQLRGMNKILIGNSPSLFTCEEIVDDAEIQIMETCKIKTWKEIKTYYKNWRFKDILKPEEQQQNKLKMINIWNGGIGQQICQELSKQLKQEIRYQQKYDLPMHQQHSSTHYIFILDDSASMIDHWTFVKNCVESQFQQISRKSHARVSVVIFNITARVVVKCEELRIEEQLKLITFQMGGGTNYGPPFQQTLEILKENQEYDNSVILFYTDGEATYPQKVIEQYGALSKKMKDSIYFLACSQPIKSSSLNEILNFFKREFIYSEWRDQITPSDLNKNWAEMISQAHLDKYKA
ncbi:unnamed protein product [Paramecium octaurelia]|uniref:VLIG-type G domain-containing protein n=2 Tax=Paramecium octaurelia TaxID=43137 RepID=A0A8S1T4T8_PAROT|nr:unnamed protein product [Paramecium octaurelia]